MNAQTAAGFRGKPGESFIAKPAPFGGISYGDESERPKLSRERFEGAFLGLALGDALGAPHEGGLAERTLWRVLGRTREGRRRWTDDTQMSIDLAESLLECGGLEPDDLARRFAASYSWSRGYGPGAAKLLKRIRRGENWRQANRSVFASGSYGNGGAMRAPVLGLFFSHDSEKLLEAARASALITHAHPLALDGAAMIATATAVAVRGQPSSEVLENAAASAQSEAYRERLALADQWLRQGMEVSVHDVRRNLGHEIAALDSVVTAVYLALRFRASDLSSLLSFIRQLGGDVDTIGAMAGAIFGAMSGRSRLPSSDLERLEQCDKIESLARAVHSAASA